MSSASFHNRFDRTLPGAFNPHVVSNAFWAASTAMSTSSSVASETFVMTCPLAGIKNVSIMQGRTEMRRRTRVDNTSRITCKIRIL